MSFVALTSGEIASGEPVSTSTQTKIKNNFDDHEARLQVAEASVAVYPPIIFRLNGYYSLAGVLTGVLKTTANFSLTVSGIRVLIDKAGSSGSTQIDLLRSRAGGSYQSLLTTKPSVLSSAGNDALSINAVLDATKVDIQAGDILRLDITAVQTGGIGFLVRVDYDRTV